MKIPILALNLYRLTSPETHSRFALEHLNFENTPKGIRITVSNAKSMISYFPAAETSPSDVGDFPGDGPILIPGRLARSLWKAVRGQRFSPYAFINRIADVATIHATRTDGQTITVMTPIAQVKPIPCDAIWGSFESKELVPKANFIIETSHRVFHTLGRMFFGMPEYYFESETRNCGGKAPADMTRLRVMNMESKQIVAEVMIMGAGS